MIGKPDQKTSPIITTQKGSSQDFTYCYYTAPYDGYATLTASGSNGSSYVGCQVAFQKIKSVNDITNQNVDNEVRPFTKSQNVVNCTSFWIRNYLPVYKGETVMCRIYDWNKNITSTETYIEFFKALGGGFLIRFLRKNKVTTIWSDFHHLSVLNNERG